jgi:hypothetical protein
MTFVAVDRRCFSRAGEPSRPAPRGTAAASIPLSTTSASTRVPSRSKRNDVCWFAITSISPEARAGPARSDVSSDTRLNWNAPGHFRAGLGFPILAIFLVEPRSRGLTCFRGLVRTGGQVVAPDLAASAAARPQIKCASLLITEPRYHYRIG